MDGSSTAIQFGPNFPQYNQVGQDGKSAGRDICCKIQQNWVPGIDWKLIHERDVIAEWRIWALGFY